MNIPDPANIEIGSNIETLSVNEVVKYIEELKIEIDRVEKIKSQKSKALDIAKEFFKKDEV